MENNENINMNINNEENGEVKNETIPQPEINKEENFEANAETNPEPQVNNEANPQVNPYGNGGSYDYRYGYPQYQQQNRNEAYGYNNQSQGNYQGYQNPQPANPQWYQYPQQNVNAQGYCQPQQNVNQQDQFDPSRNYYRPNPYYQPKNRIIAGLFGIIFGGIGLHNFYLGYTGRAIAQLLVSVFTCGIGSVWGFIEGIMIIAGAYKNNLDANGFFTRDI